MYRRVLKLSVNLFVLIAQQDNLANLICTLTEEHRFHSSPGRKWLPENLIMSESTNIVLLVILIQT